MYNSLKCFNGQREMGKWAVQCTFANCTDITFFLCPVLSPDFFYAHTDCRRKQLNF